MSSIKPPTGKSPSLPPAGEVGTAAVRGNGPKAPSDAFRKTLDEPAASVARPEPKTVAAALVRDLRAGHIDADTVVNKLVDKALAKADAAGLPAAKRVELEAMLRDALVSDPTLSQLSKDLERGR